MGFVVSVDKGVRENDIHICDLIGFKLEIYRFYKLAAINMLCFNLFIFDWLDI